jgi:hypothetical protein
MPLALWVVGCGQFAHTFAGRCLIGVDHGSDEPFKLVPIDEQPNHEIVHALRLGEAQCATH